MHHMKTAGIAELYRFAALQSLRIAVDRPYHARGGIKDRAGVTACAESAVHVNALGFRRERADDFFEENRNVLEFGSVLDARRTAHGASFFVASEARKASATRASFARLMPS